MSLTTPQEYARMKDEYSEGLLRQTEYEKGAKENAKENARITKIIGSEALASQCNILIHK